MTGLAVTAVGRKNYGVENNNMDKNSIDKLHQILKVQEHLKKIEYMMTTSRSRIFSKFKRDEHTGLWYGGEYVDLDDLDAVSSKEIRVAITTIVQERYKALDDEIKKL